MVRRKVPLLVLSAMLLPLMLAACGSPSSSSGMKGMSGMGSSSLPSWASSLKLKVVSPADGVTVTGTELPLHLAFSGYTPSCLRAGSPVERGTGHYHIYLDNRLISMFCTADVDVSMQNVTTGKHRLTIEPALNDHQLVTQNAVHLTFTNRPTAPLPWISSSPTTGTPSIKIVAPANGNTVSGVFDVTVQATNFDLSCPLQGKSPVSGTGDWNLNHDSLQTGMGGMATMIRISCTNTIQVSTASMKAGQHTLIAYLSNNEGTALVPLDSDQIVLTVK